MYMYIYIYVYIYAHIHTSLVTLPGEDTSADNVFKCNIGYLK